MNIETQLNILKNFAEHHHNLINSPSVGNNLEQCLQKKYIESNIYINQFMERSISKISKFSDSTWDFNSDYPNAARNVQGAKLRINFSKYNDIPRFILTEIKVIFELALLNNTIFWPQYNKKTSGKKKYAKGVLKANTLIPIFENGLTFINEIFKQLNLEFGFEYVQTKFKTLTALSPAYYHKAAKNYERIKNTELDRFFEYLRNPSSIKYVFNKPIAYVDLNNLCWKNPPNTHKIQKKQVLPDNIFEYLSKMASFIVVDFLNAIGDKSKISDINSLERFEASKYSSWANNERVNHEILNAYIAMRLRTKGYSSSCVLGLIKPSDWMINKNGLAGGLTLRKALKSRKYELNKLREYFNLVAYSCLYLVGQYTGMRPSELAEIKVKDCSCLVQDDGVWLIESTIKKHQQEINTGLFDDRWVAIPIVRDTILAASYIAKIKSSPYLVSNMNTVHPTGSEKSMSSNGISYQINALISQLLGEYIANQISFNSYMLRHTLTYQLFRAEVGLPLISFQLKHFVAEIGKFVSKGATTSVTLGYGEIGEILSKDGNRNSKNSLRHAAELEAIKNVFNHNGTFYGGKANEHKKNLITLFQGYMVNGYTEEEVYEALANQGAAVTNIGNGLCYGNKQDDTDPALPCIGSLRCNPIRCKHAIVTLKHAPKWREIYIVNKANLNKPGYEHLREQMLATMNEAVMVLENLGEKVEL